MSQLERPFPTSPFIGRVEELAEITRRLHDPACRLLTIAGPGGIGKTRLALQACDQLADSFPDGVYFIPLQPLNHIDFLAPTLVEALGLCCYSKEDIRLQLFGHLHKKRALLVLDNFEHLMNGAYFLSDILMESPTVKLLVTSREVLNLQDEWLFYVDGLQVPESPDVKDVEGYSAVRLFNEVARRVQPEFSLAYNIEHVVKICQYLEGMPLAIEIAAVWLKTLPCRVLAQEIRSDLNLLVSTKRDIPERHRSMRVVFEHSWRQLTEPEKEIFSRLSVFQGSFEYEAAQIVAGADLFSLQAFTDKSLLRVSCSGRYIIHELLRQYLVEKLCDQCGTYDPVRDLHCTYFAEFMLRQEGRLKGSEQKSALAEVDAELDNLRHAWSWAVEQEKRDKLSKLVEGLFLYYQMRSLVREGLELFSKAIHHLEREEDSLLADLHIYTAWFEAIAGWRAPWHPIQGKYETAAKLFQTGVSLLKSDSGDTTILPLSGINFLDRLWDEEWVPRLFEERLSQYRENGNRWGEAWALLSLGNWSLISGKKDDASKFTTSSLDIFRSLGDRWGSTWPLYLLGTLAHEEKRYPLAHQLLEETLHICQDIGDQGGAAYLLGHLGIVTAAQKAYEESLGYLIAAVEKSYQTRWEFETAWHLMDLADVLAEAGNLEQAAELYSFLNVFPPFIQGRDNVEKKLKELAQRIPEQSFEILRVRGEAHSMESLIQAVRIEFVPTGEPARQAPSGPSVQPSLVDPLTERELIVLELVAEGLSNREIAERLVVTVGTAKKHLNNIFRKLQVQSRTQAVARMHDLNINPHIHPLMDDKSTL